MRAPVLVAVLAGCCFAFVGCGRHVLISLHPGEGEQNADAGAVDAGRDGEGSREAATGPRQEGGGRDAGGALDVDAGDADAAAGDAAVPGAEAGVPAVSLRVRYDFAGTGDVIVDRAGEADGVALGGAELAGDGTLGLDGEDDYVNLPNGLVSALDAATFMVWFEWKGGICWQRVFDFGSNDEGEDQVGRASTSLFLTPLVCGRDNAAVFVERGSTQHVMNLEQPLPVDTVVQLTLTVDPGADLMRLYVDGELQAESGVPFTFDQLEDENAWLGRSQWVQDHHVHGRYDEFRLYDGALTAEEILSAYQRGPDAP